MTLQIFFDVSDFVTDLVTDLVPGFMTKFFTRSVTAFVTEFEKNCETSFVTFCYGVAMWLICDCYVVAMERIFS